MSCFTAVAEVADSEPWFAIVAFTVVTFAWVISSGALVAM